MGSSEYVEERVNWDDFLIDPEHDTQREAPRVITITVTPSVDEETGEPTTDMTVHSVGFADEGILSVLQLAYAVTIDSMVESGEWVVDDDE